MYYARIAINLFEVTCLGWLFVAYGFISFCKQGKNPTARIEHEASTSKIGEDQLFYFQQRGIDYEKAMAAMISGFCRDVFNELPDEFGAEVNQLMSLKLEGSVG